MSLYLDDKAREQFGLPSTEQQIIEADKTKKVSFGPPIRKLPSHLLGKFRDFQPHVLLTIPEEPDEQPQDQSDYRKRCCFLDQSYHSPVKLKKTCTEQPRYNKNVYRPHKYWSKIKRFEPIGRESSKILIAMDSLSKRYFGRVPNVEKTAKYKHRLKRSNNLKYNENRNPNVSEITPFSTKRKELPMRLRDLQKPCNKKGCYEGNDDGLSKLITNFNPF